MSEREAGLPKVTTLEMIEVESTIGLGRPDDPVRRVKDYFYADGGRHVFRKDPAATEAISQRGVKVSVGQMMAALRQLSAAIGESSAVDRPVRATISVSPDVFQALVKEVVAFSRFHPINHDEAGMPSVTYAGIKVTRG